MYSNEPVKRNKWYKISSHVVSWTGVSIAIILAFSAYFRGFKCQAVGIDWILQAGCAIARFELAILLGLCTIVAVAYWIREACSRPDFWFVIKPILDELHRHCFRHKSNEKVDSHRVSLFRYYDTRWVISRWDKRWNRPWGKNQRRGCNNKPNSGWLRLVARSRDSKLLSKITFLAPLAHRADSEGVAGLIWREEGIIRTIKLEKVDAASDAAKVAKYAAESRIDIRFVQKAQSSLAAGRHLPVEFSGFEIRHKHQIWGVVVLDSYVKDGIQLDNQAFQSIQTAQSILSRLLTLTDRV